MKKGFLKHGEHEQDFELNITSIIDCFVVLIAFVLISTSFFSIGIIDAEVASGGATEVSENVGGLVIELKADHTILVRSDASTQETRITSRDSGKNWDYESLTGALKALKVKMPDLHSAILVADNSVAYRDVMTSMEIAKGQVPSVNLGGF